MAAPPDSDEWNGQELEIGGFSEDRLRIDRIVHRLDVTDDLTERADLGSEPVRAVSRYEDTFERTLHPRLEGSRSEPVLELDGDREALREAMDDIHQRTMEIDPRNVRASDGQGFEDTLTAVIVQLRKLLTAEDAALSDLVRPMTPRERQELAGALAHAYKNASERPRPPRTAVGRFLSNAHVKLDHTLEDASTPRHPGAETVNG